MPAPAKQFRLINLGTDRKVFGPWYDKGGQEEHSALHLASTDPVDPGREAGSSLVIDAATKARLEALPAFKAMTERRRVEIRSV
jgi:hypothetical protein